MNHGAAALPGREGRLSKGNLGPLQTPARRQASAGTNDTPQICRYVASAFQRGRFNLSEMPLAGAGSWPRR
jgi:hypothetical protein